MVFYWALDYKEDNDFKKFTELHNLVNSEELDPISTEIVEWQKKYNIKNKQI